MVDGTPQILKLAVDLQEYFIEMPPVAESSAAGSNPFGIHPAKLQTPFADALEADGDATFGHHLFDVSAAERKSKIKPSAMTDDHGWKAIAATGSRIDDRCVHAATAT